MLGFLKVLLLLGTALAQDKYFPEDFSFGVSTAAYQVEGGWNADGKGESIWDKLLHDDPSFVYQNQNGDVAADTYHHAVDDIQYLKAMGVKHYRFSISWSRILPNGQSSYINEAGVAYYNKLIDALVNAGIQPLVTLHHWDLPNGLQDFGGFLNRDIAQYFEDYARVCFDRFGDRVKHWLTFNEPISTCRGGYEDGSMAPVIKNQGTGAYECAHTVLLAHGKAYRAYEKDFKSQQQGKVSITIDTNWFEPATQTDTDKEASNRNLIFNYEWWMTPIIEGDYPDLIKTVVAENSKEEGLEKSRLPEFSEDEKTMMKGTFDFIALNHYTSLLCKPGNPWDTKISSWYRDVAVDCYQPDDWKPGSGWLRYTPWGMRRILNFIKDRYGNPEVIITENGYSDGGELEDHDRIEFHRGYLDDLLDAILEDGCNVTGYTAWSFLDDFEWTAGFLAKFGLIRVDFDHDERTRTPKMSSYVYQNIIETRKVDWNYNPPWPPQSWNITKKNKQSLRFKSNKL